MIDQVKIKVVRNDGSITILTFITDDHKQITMTRKVPDGAGGFITKVITYGGVKRDATPENIEAELVRAGLDFQSYTIIEDADIPTRNYRDAWADGSGTAIIHDMTKAAEIMRDKLRIARAPLLTALDVEMSRAFDDKVLQAEIEAKRQALRDVTIAPAIENAKNIEALDALIPVLLAAGVS